MDFALTIIKNTHDFEKGLSEWVTKPEDEKTYRNIKIHFNDALDHLQDIRGDDMLQSSSFHANMMKTDMMANVQAIRDDILEAIQDNDKENVPPATMEYANAAQVDVLSKLVKTVDSLATRLEKMENTNGTLRQCSNTNNIDDIPFWKKPNNKFLYCWSCGSNRTHAGNECNKKKDGHIDNATFDNRQGGSTYFIAKRFR